MDILRFKNPAQGHSPLARITPDSHLAVPPAPKLQSAMPNNADKRAEIAVWFDALVTLDYDMIRKVPAMFATPARATSGPAQSPTPSSNNPPRGSVPKGNADSGATSSATETETDETRKPDDPAAHGTKFVAANVNFNFSFVGHNTLDRRAAFASLVADVIQDSQIQFPSPSDKTRASTTVASGIDETAMEARAEKRARSSDRSPAYQPGPMFEKSVALLDALARQRADDIASEEHTRPVAQDGFHLTSTLVCEKLTSPKAVCGRLRVKRPLPV